MLKWLVAAVGVVAMSSEAASATAAHRGGWAGVENTSAVANTVMGAGRQPPAAEREHGSATQEAADAMMVLGGVRDGATSAGGHDGVAMDDGVEHTLPPVVPGDENPPIPKPPDSSSAPPLMLPPPRGALIELRGSHLEHVVASARRVVVTEGAPPASPLACRLFPLVDASERAYLACGAEIPRWR